MDRSPFERCTKVICVFLTASHEKWDSCRVTERNDTSLERNVKCVAKNGTCMDRHVTCLVRNVTATRETRLELGETVHVALETDSSCKRNVTCFPKTGTSIERSRYARLTSRVT